MHTAVDELNTFVKSIEDGGTGVQYKNTFVPNPEPFDIKINLTSFNNNPLSLHYIKHEKKCVKKDDLVELVEPSVRTLDQPAKYYQTGRMRGARPSLDDQLNIIRWCIGTHKTLLTHYKDIAERRSKLVHLWVAGDPKGNMYVKLCTTSGNTITSSNYNVSKSIGRGNDIRRRE